MSEDKAKLATARSATEYRLSIGSAPTSRRSSIGESSSVAKFTGQEGLTGSTGECSGNAIQQVLLPKIRELTDSIITLDSNFTHLNFIHESLADLNESLGSLLYGIMSNSWCVEFSQAPHDIQEDLIAIKQLESLEDEKKNLLEEISNIERGASKTNADVPRENKLDKDSQKKQFSQPLFPSSQVRKYRPYDNKDKRRSTKAANNLSTDNEEDYDDDTSSEASFVLNPTNIGTSKSSQGHVSKNARSNNNNNSKLRRKSILHTIRNSIASGADLPGIENDNVINLGDLHNRISLGSGAARIVNGPMAKKRHSMFTENAERTSTENRHSIAKKPEKKLSARPPFR
ncbi:hypothetical protein SEUBUCD646_0G03710 [Saccharomyces eubayanus]|uniref:DASH complex subunit DAM1 n=1 Tax=Saccharomyces eubayanus TaxID=1080349 RepID=A0ABN8VTH3_SACEU|nr:hypothetical protein SEUBUCD650_0G03690 [Saccharomyces eubayanus]CAI2025129.1 hypothetical protein SEUBUCD646_0G03710 [Saccharomyces eubayanus]